MPLFHHLDLVNGDSRLSLREVTVATKQSLDKFQVLFQDQCCISKRRCLIYCRAKMKLSRASERQLTTLPLLNPCPSIAPQTSALKRLMKYSVDFP